jgi:hypothetical protein
MYGLSEKHWAIPCVWNILFACRHRRLLLWGPVPFILVRPNLSCLRIHKNGMLQIEMLQIVSQHCPICHGLVEPAGLICVRVLGAICKPRRSFHRKYPTMQTCNTKASHFEFTKHNSHLQILCYTGPSPTLAIPNIVSARCCSTVHCHSEVMISLILYVWFFEPCPSPGAFWKPDMGYRNQFSNRALTPQHINPSGLSKLQFMTQFRFWFCATRITLLLRAHKNGEHRPSGEKATAVTNEFSFKILWTPIALHI